MEHVIGEAITEGGRGKAISPHSMQTSVFGHIDGVGGGWKFWRSDSIQGGGCSNVPWAHSYRTCLVTSRADHVPTHALCRRRGNKYLPATPHITPLPEQNTRCV